MAQYKVLQDIEAEDKLLGPLSLRQFIYAAIVVVLLFVAWKLLMVQWLLAIPFIPPVVFFGLLAAPFGHDQSSEVWMLAKIKYYVFPRRRIWDQDGIRDLVTITAPKAIQKPATKDFNKEEAKSRLKALAATMDTRGWAIRNIATNGYQNPYGQAADSDRLLELQAIPADSLVAVKASDDVLDAVGTPLAQTMNSLQQQNQQAHRQAILQKMQTLAAQQKQAPAVAVVAPTPAARVLAPQPQAVTPVAAPAILKEVETTPPKTELRINEPYTNDDDQANEVVISLH